MQRPWVAGQEVEQKIHTATGKWFTYFDKFQWKIDSLIKLPRTVVQHRCWYFQVFKGQRSYYWRSISYREYNLIGIFNMSTTFLSISQLLTLTPKWMKDSEIWLTFLSQVKKMCDQLLELIEWSVIEAQNFWHQRNIICSKIAIVITRFLHSLNNTTNFNIFSLFLFFYMLNMCGFNIYYFVNIYYFEIRSKM